MSYNHYKLWLINYFKEKNSEESQDGFDTKSNYFDLGLIDSLGLIELIDKIEAHFRIQFNEYDFQDRRFSSIEGLSEIISELREDKE